MSTSYVDVNARNSKIERPSTNNIWEFNLPNTVELPTGTEISVQNALINLQGITGASIEIEEDIEESIMFQYYLSDSTYEAPNRELAPDLTKITSFNIYSRMDQHYNFNEFDPTTYPTNDVGWSENIMPLVCNYILSKPGGALESNTMPFCGEAKIKIKKGIYSISKIATLISDQINLVTNPENENNLITEAKLAGSYTGFLYNQTTNRAARVEPAGFWAATVPTGVPQTPYTSAQGVKPLTFNTFTNPLSFVAVTNNFNEQIRDEIKQGNWGNDQNQEQKFEYFTAANQPNRKYFIGFEAVNGTGPEFDGSIYNLFSQNSMGVGTSSFNIGYSTTDSAFTIQNLHEPRRLPTHDRYGNVVKNAGQSCAYLKRVPDGFVPEGTSQINTLNSPVQRYSGITIYNWGWDTAKRLGQKWRTKTNANLPDDQVDNASKFARFGEFFPSKAEAEAAWATTLWARLGFSYDDIQDPTSYTEQRFFDEQPETTNGFTTRQEVDASAIPYISTIFNGAQGGVGSTEAPKPVGSQIEPLPQSIASIQNFNLLDINVPNLGYNNNKNVPPGIAVVAPYQASFYREAVMIPIQTKGRDVTASNLPILSENGYLYILSDLIEPNDIVKYKDNVGLLDQLPKSNLSNQDFIADRTAIVHTLTNPKLINSIRIMVLNPDLRDVALQLNSSVLLKITKPRLPPTIFQSNIENNTTDEGKEGELQKAIAQKQKAQAKEDALLGVEEPIAQPTTTASDIAETAALGIEAPPPAKKKTTKPRKPRQKKIKE